MIKVYSVKKGISLFFLIGAFVFSVNAQEQESLKVSNETYEILKRVSKSSLADGSILLSLTTHQDLGWIDEIEKCVVMRDTQWITPFIHRLSYDGSFEMDIEQTSIIQEYVLRHPEKKQEITRRLHEGRMLIGATYTQPYEEMYFSESLARQFYLGKLWLKKEFDGYNATSYYNSDVPGRAMQMPQLMAKAGVENMFISRHERGVFDWYSPDGSKVTTYSPGHYIDFYNILGKTDEEALKELASQALIWSDGYNDIPGQETVMPAVLNFEFIWDPKPVENLDPFTQLWNNLEEVENEQGEKLDLRLPEIKFSTLDKFFTQIRKSTLEMPSITGERPNVWIYIHGPSHHWALDYSRQADILLPAAEKFATADALVSGTYSKYPVELFNQAWESKIYPDHGWGGKGGQSTDDIFLMRYADSKAKAERLLENSLQSLAGKVNTSHEKGIPLIVFNSLSWDRSSPLSVHVSFDPNTAKSIRVFDKSGEEVPVQLDQIRKNDTGYLLSAELSFVASNVPSMGYDTYYIQLTEEEVHQKATVFSSDFENEFYRAELANGGLSSLFDKELGRELIESSTFKAGEIFTMKSEGNGAGEFDAVQQPEMEGFDRTGNYETAWEMTTDGPVFTSYKYRQPIRNAVAELKITFYHQIKKVDFDVNLMNWDGTMFREFRMALPLQILNGEVAYEAPFGVVEVGKDEMPGAAGERYTIPCKDLHPRGIENWISASGAEFGLTLSSSVGAMDYVDPTGKGYENTILQPILLASRRSCHWEGNDYHQTGNHSFAFSISSHNPGWKNGVKQGREANEKLLAILDPARYADAGLSESMSFLQLDAENVIVSAMKKAEHENAVVVRLYNLNEEETEVNLRFSEKLNEAWRTNLIEEREEEFEIKNGALQLTLGNQAIETILLIR
jgi:alpha-mannosidase